MLLGEAIIYDTIFSFAIAMESQDFLKIFF
jgi:hypothetical protein